MQELPFATPPITPILGTIKHVPEDFEVEEIPAYRPTGEGEHLFVRFVKRDLDTRQAVQRLARALGVEAGEAGFAGLKDRRAVTTQWASFYRGDPARLESTTVEGVRVLEWARHPHKLRTGQLRGNRFRIRLRGSDPARADDARAVLEALARSGVPAYFGEQRFGRAHDNAARAIAWIAEETRAPRDPFERKLLFSAWQASLFNELCAERVREGTYDSVIDGDLCRKEQSGGLFVVADIEVERQRAQRFEISATGPMFGATMRWPEGEARRREERALARAGVGQEQLVRLRRAGAGTRRPYRMPLHAPRVDSDAEGLVLSFELPAGAYATVVLRELTRDAPPVEP